jgi:hypothetical protein
MKSCRYLGHLDGRDYCAYWDMPLRGDEDLRCHLGGWECYEEPGGCIFEGRWMTLAEYEYAGYLESKSGREIPEGFEFQEFRLDREGLADLSRSEKRCPVESMTGYHLKMRPEYPKTVNAVVIAHFQYDTSAKRLYFDRPQGSQWVASLWIVDGPCEVDLAVVLKEGRLDFIEGYCSHGDFCPKVEELKRAILESAAFAKLRKDLIDELSQGRVADLDRGGPQQFRQTVPPVDEDRNLSP